MYSFSNTVLTECVYMCKNSANCKQLYTKYDGYVGNVVHTRTIYHNFICRFYICSIYPRGCSYARSLAVVCVYVCVCVYQTAVLCQNG